MAGRALGGDRALVLHHCQPDVVGGPCFPFRLSLHVFLSLACLAGLHAFGDGGHVQCSADICTVVQGQTDAIRPLSLDRAGCIPGNALAFLTLSAQALSDGLLLMTVIPWLLCLVCYCGLHVTYTRDKAAAQAAEVRTVAGAGCSTGNIVPRKPLQHLERQRHGVGYRDTGNGAAQRREMTEAARAQPSIKLGAPSV